MKSYMIMAIVGSITASMVASQAAFPEKSTYCEKNYVYYVDKSVIRTLIEGRKCDSEERRKIRADAIMKCLMPAIVATTPGSCRRGGNPPDTDIC